MKPPGTFWQGFRALAPLWIGAVPFGLAYVVAARQAGLQPLEIQLMSLTIFSAAVQISLAGLLAAGAAWWTITLTSLALLAQNILYGYTLRQRLNFTPPTRLLAAYWLTDGAFALTMAAGEAASAAYLLGTEASMFFIWNTTTLAGLLLNEVAGSPAGLGLDFAIPLMFLVLVVPMVRVRFDGLAVTVALLVAVAGGLWLPGGLAVLGAGLATAAFGGWFGPGSRKPAGSGA